MSDFISEMDDEVERVEEAFIPSDDPEPITAEEAAQTDIPLPEAIAPEDQERHLAQTVCAVCLELNLTSKSVIKCARCEQAFCLHYASNVDAQYCVNCLSDISVTKQVITKTYEHRNEQGEKTFYRRRAREVKIDGLDWLFAQRKIYELSDVELDMSIEYHRNIATLMLAEQEKRRSEYMHRNAGVKYVIPTPATTTVTDGTTTTVKKTRTVSKTKQQEQLAALMSMIGGGNVDMNAIAAILNKKS